MIVWRFGIPSRIAEWPADDFPLGLTKEKVNFETDPDYTVSVAPILREYLPRHKDINSCSRSYVVTDVNARTGDGKEKNKGQACDVCCSNKGQAGPPTEQDGRRGRQRDQADSGLGCPGSQLLRHFDSYFAPVNIAWRPRWPVIACLVTARAWSRIAPLGYSQGNMPLLV